MPMSSAALCALAALLALSACASPASSADSAPVAPAAAADYPLAYVKAVCHVDAGCAAPQYSSEARCVLVNSGIVQKWSSAIQEVAAGKSSYDVAAAQRCFSAVQCTPQSPFLSLAPTECDVVFTGASADGATCAQDVDCAGGRCRNCVCQGLKPLGGDCVFATDCDATLACVMGKCVAAGSGKSGDTCSGNSCASGLKCWSNNVCAPLPTIVQIGEPCGNFNGVAHGDCAPDGWCFINNDGSGVCKPRSQVGGSCWNTVPFSSACADGLQCLLTAAGVATCAPLGSAGEACTSNGCRFKDLVCTGADTKTTCQPLAQVGEACTMCSSSSGIGVGCPNPCIGEATCDNGLCVAFGGDGASCATRPCASGVNCGQDKVCHAKVALGSACTESQACVTGKCDAASGKCVAYCN